MPKSKYPQELDTSVEIQPVRNNILEVGSDVINSLRSAIFNIEKTLGINPQGAVGNTLAERINKSLDSNGNIKSDALIKANILTGPIIDNNVSNVASIKESKLKLDFPTKFLQSEISILSNNLNDLITKINELSVEISAHLNEKALNRHSASAISVLEHSFVQSDESLKNISSSNVQDVFENIIDGHINYSGTNISDENNSHTAAQIYFDNQNVSDFVSNNNLQDVIEELTDISLNSQITHQDLLHSNGVLKISNITQSSDFNFGNLLNENFAISFNKSVGNSLGISTIYITTPFEIGSFNLKKSDIITISDDSNPDADYNKSFEINDFIISGGNLISLTIFGFLSDDSTLSTRGKITKNIALESNKLSLLTTTRENPSLTSASTIQICNPNAVKIISSGIKPQEITTSKRYIGVKVNDNDVISIDLYNGDYTNQTIDSVIARINEQVAEQALLFSAYRVDFENKSSEIALALNIPDDEDNNYSLTISQNTDLGIDVSGFSDQEDEEIFSEFGTNYFIEGKSFSGLKSKLNTSLLNFSTSSNIVNSGSSNVDFLSIGIKANDLITILNSSNSSDDGTYIIENVTDDQLTLSSEQLPTGFSGTSQAETKFLIFENTISFDNFSFDEVSETYGSLLADIFLDKERNIFIDKRFEYTSVLLSTKSLITLVDFIGDIENKEFELSVSSGTDFINLSLDSGDTISIRGNNSYAWITSGSNNVKLKLLIPSIADINSYITNLGSNFTMTFYGFAGANINSNLFISRVSFDNFNSRINGGANGSRTISLIEKGNVGLNEINNSVKNKFVEEPLSDLRSTGVISGLSISSSELISNLYKFNLSSGICYVNGKRIEVEGQVITTNINSTTVDKIYIAVDYDGLIVVESSTPSCECPFEFKNYCLLGTIEFDSSNLYEYDLRLFINELDLKLLNSITVSPQIGMGHFTDFSKAIQYSKRFSEIYPNAGTPTIHLKSGTHSIITTFDNSDLTYADWFAQSNSVKVGELVDTLYVAGLVVDFPVNIEGEGDSTIISLRNKYIFSDATYTFRGSIVIVGDGFTSHTKPLTKLTAGFISFKNLKMDNCRFQIPDFNIVNGSNEPYYNGIIIDSVIFKMKGFATTNVFDTSIGPRCITFNEVDDTTRNKGNLTVNNCIFMVEDTEPSGKSTIILPNATRIKNLIFSNNQLLGVDSASNVRFFDNNIWEFSSANSGANITLTGNISSSNFNTVGSGSEPHMITGVSSWGDRISRSLKVGGTLTAGDDITSTGFSYSSTQTRKRNIFFEDLSVTTLGNASSGTSFSTLSVNGRTWRTIEFSDNTTDFMAVRLNILPGETLTAISIVFGTEDPADSIFGGFSLKITSENAYGDETVQQAYTAMGSVTSGLGSSNEAGAQGTTGLSFTGADNKNFIIYLKRAVTTGYNQHLMYIQYTTTMTDVQAIGGLT